MNVLEGVIVWGFTIFMGVGVILIFLGALHERYHEMTDGRVKRRSVWHEEYDQMAERARQRRYDKSRGGK